MVLMRTGWMEQIFKIPQVCSPSKLISKEPSTSNGTTDLTVITRNEASDIREELKIEINKKQMMY